MSMWSDFKERASSLYNSVFGDKPAATPGSNTGASPQDNSGQTATGQSAGPSSTPSPSLGARADKWMNDKLYSWTGGLLGDAPDAAPQGQKDTSATRTGGAGDATATDDPDNNDSVIVRAFKNLLKGIVALFALFSDMFSGNLLGMGKDVKDLFSAVKGSDTAPKGPGPVESLENSVKSEFNSVEQSVTNTWHHASDGVAGVYHSATGKLGQARHWATNLIPPAGILATITGAATQHGVDPTALLTMSKIESGWNPTASTPSGHAQGLFQFIPDTWSRFGLGSRMDAAASSDAGARLYRENEAGLARDLHRQPVAGEVYLAHQQGEAGAAALLNHAHDGTTAAEALMETKAYRGNLAKAQNAIRSNLPADLQDRAASMSAGDFANLWTSKFDHTYQAIVAANAPNAQHQQNQTQLATSKPPAPLGNRPDYKHQLHVEAPAPAGTQLASAEPKGKVLQMKPRLDPNQETLAS